MLLECYTGLATTRTESQPCLVEQARTSKEAFTELFRQHYDEIFAYCARRLPKRTDAEDTTSTVFMKMLNNFDNFRGDNTAFRCWIYRIASNEVNSFYRKAGRDNRLLTTLKETFDPEDYDEDLGPDNNHDSQLIKAALLEMKPDVQDLISLRFFQGLSNVEIADILKIQPTTVRSKVSRALKKLQKELKKIETLTGKRVSWNG